MFYLVGFKRKKKRTLKILCKSEDYDKVLRAMPLLKDEVKFFNYAILTDVEADKHQPPRH